MNPADYTDSKPEQWTVCDTCGGPSYIFHHCLTCLQATIDRMTGAEFQTALKKVCTRIINNTSEENPSGQQIEDQTGVGTET